MERGREEIEGEYASMSKLHVVHIHRFWHYGKGIEIFLNTQYYLGHLLWRKTVTKH